MPVACARTNVRQVVSICRLGAGGIRNVLRTRQIVEAPTRWPSLRSSPWIPIGSLRAHKCPPGGVDLSFGCRRYPQRLKDAADRGGADPMAELAKLALD